MTDTVALPRRGEPVEDVKKADPADLRLWGATTLLSVMDKPALVYWAANVAAECAVKSQAAWKAIEESSGSEEAQRWIASSRFRANKGQLTAAALGSTVHAACEEMALTGVRPDGARLVELVAEQATLPADAQRAEAQVVAVMLDRFSEWLDQFQPAYTATELTVFNPACGYAGTCDGFFVVDGMRLIFDIKTTREARGNDGKLKDPYPEAALQLSAYRHAPFAAVWRPRRVMENRRRYYALSQAEIDLAVAVPQVDNGAVLHISPEACRLFPVRCDDVVFERFLHVCEVARWKFEMENTVIGAPLVAPGEAA